MRRTTLFFASSMLALATTTAHAAPSLGGVRIESDGDDIAVRVLADAPLENARVRTESGRLRVWFSGVENRPRLEIDGDGRAIRAVALGPGMEETVVLRVDLGHDVRVPASDVRIEPTPDGCLVHVPTAWLPPAPVAPPSSVEPTPSEAATNAAPSAAPIAPAAADSADVDPSTASAARTRRSGAAPATPEDEAPALGARRTEEGPTALGTRPASELPIATLGILALALFGAWVYAKKHRRAGAERSDIQILATHRLGPKHQLLVVRALGQDHLLAVHGQTTQVLGTTKPNEERPSTFLTRLREASDERAAPPPPAHSAEDADERFGARLLSLVGGRDVAPKQNPTGTSDSVAGLLRLKARQENG
ncbi:MAG: flagellar biosynthetic protein FliO [Myxococcota bacterium]|jgi:flagellar biogenesis protein FliO|nr:flagellar biosynthetic protein FliO [Myxococcota bacterium]